MAWHFQMQTTSTASPFVDPDHFRRQLALTGLLRHNHLFWGVELTRMQNLGADTFYGAMPAVEAFAHRTRELHAIRQAVVDWPGAPF